MLVQQIRRRGADINSLAQSPHVHFSYAQFGEDLLVSHLLRHDNGFYVDVGCHDPFKYSNTYLLHQFRNWRGINIDADANAIERFRQHRPHDQNLNFGVGEENGFMKFTTFDDPARNTFSGEMVEHASKSVRVSDARTVEVLTLETILDRYLSPGQKIDYLNIDCEGFDEKVIRSNNWTKYSPHFLSVEIHGLDLSEPKANPVVRFLIHHGFKLRSHHLVTSIFQNMRWST